MSVLVFERDTQRLSDLSEDLRTAGFRVLGLTRVAELERWPAGEIVVTDWNSFTPFWKDVGAAAVIVLAETEEQGADACERGATAWLPHATATHALIATIVNAGGVASVN